MALEMSGAEPAIGQCIAHLTMGGKLAMLGLPAKSMEVNWSQIILKAITINGRIGVLYSNKDYGCEWDYDFRNKRFLAEDNTKFGVNIILYALNAI